MWSDFQVLSIDLKIFYEFHCFILVEVMVRFSSFYREVLALKDEGQVALDWLDPTFNCSAETPVIVILPGLTGTSQAEYVKGLALAVNRVGQRVVIFNNRGIGGIELKVNFKLILRK